MPVDDDTGAYVAVRGRTAILRPLNRPDLPHMYRWRTDLASIPLWSSQFRRVVPYEEFVHEMEGWLRDAITMIVVDASTGEPAGFVRAYHLNVADGWAYVMGFTEKRFRKRRHVGEAATLFASHLFRTFPLRKICCEVFEYNELSLGLVRKIGFREVGRLREHIWWDDRYWDLFQFELFREEFNEAMRRFSFITSIELEAERELAGNGRPR